MPASKHVVCGMACETAFGSFTADTAKAAAGGTIVLQDPQGVSLAGANEAGKYQSAEKRPAVPERSKSQGPYVEETDKSANTFAAYDKRIKAGDGKSLLSF